MSAPTATEMRAMRRVLERFNRLDSIAIEIRPFFVYPDAVIRLLTSIALRGGRGIRPRFERDAEPSSLPGWIGDAGWLLPVAKTAEGDDVMEMRPELLAAFVEEAGLFGAPARRR